MKYWVFKVKQEVGGLYCRSGTEIYEHRMTDGFWGIKEDPAKSKSVDSLESLEKGDHVIFYLVEPGQESRFLGTATIDSNYHKIDSEKEAKIIHKAYLDCDQGVFLKEIDRWSSSLSVENLRGKGPFGDGRARFGPFFQGSVKLLESAEAFETIINEHKLFSDLKTPKRKTKFSKFKR